MLHPTTPSSQRTYSSLPPTRTLPPTLTSLTPQWKQSFRRRLLTWYAKHARDLPWRKSSNPYRVWVSEVMLQQTQVETVKAYFQRFMKAFPTVKKLAVADEQEVLRLWEGLGYYRRARGLHAAAQQIVDEHGGRFPRDVATLQTLPGIGRYTAGAIVSIAFDERAPILEANTIRLFARLIGYREAPTKSAGQKVLWQTAEEVLPRKKIANFNQALMELGSLVCKPSNPLCEECPVASLCVANETGAQESIPLSTKKVNFTDVNEAAVVVYKKGKVLLRQCGENERWAGLWDFPRFALDSEGPLFVHDELVAKVQEQTGVTIKPGGLLKTIKHGVTRYRITLDCYEANYTSGKLKRTVGKTLRWCAMKELRDLPLSSTGRKIAKFIAS
ncbi:MAG: A/G-specific adenine glycosylase [Planctomycetes bacterium]|nr:A/G-specific adenine glycosylase [Planctomycetota bacterium]